MKFSFALFQMSGKNVTRATGEFQQLYTHHMWYFWWFTNLATWDGWTFQMKLFISNSAGFRPAFWIEAPKKKGYHHGSPWILMDHQWLRVFQKRPKEMDGRFGVASSLFTIRARVEIQNVWVDKKNAKRKVFIPKSRSGKHVLEVTSCCRSLQKKIWRYATSGPPRFLKGVEWVEVTYQKQAGHPTQILVPGDSATFVTWPQGGLTLELTIRSKQQHTGLRGCLQWGEKMTFFKHKFHFSGMYVF